MKRKRVVTKRFANKVISFLCAFAIMFSILGQVNLTNVFASESSNSCFEGDMFEVKFDITSKWKGAFNANITINNKSDVAIDNWHLSFYMDNKITNIWNAKICSEENGIYTIKNAIWNQDIPANGSVSFGFTASCGEVVVQPKSYCIPTKREIVEKENYNVELSYSSIWNNGYTANCSITNTSDKSIEDWKIVCNYCNSITSIWNADICITDNDYIFREKGYNQNIAPKGNISFGFTGNSKAQMSDVLENIQLSQVVLADISTLDTDNDGISDEMELIAGSDPYFVESEDKITISLCNYAYDEKSEKYQIYDEFKKITGTVKDRKYLKQFSYIINNSNGVELCRGDINKDEAWSEDIEGLVMGENILKVTATYKNNSTYTKEVKLHNYFEENMRNLDIDMNDDDGDGVINYLEDLYGSDKNAIDTDGDGVSDYVEIADIGSDPSSADSNGDGIADGKDDTDKDGLNDADEVLYGCSVISKDTDNDGISDNDEILNGTNPLAVDSDKDGIYDSDEKVLGLDPASNDTDGDGIIDSEEINNKSFDLSDYSNLIEAYDNLNINVYSKGDNSLTFDFDVETGAPYINCNTPGYMSDMFVFKTKEQISYAELSCDINAEAIKNDAVPAVYYFDEENKQLILVEHQSYKDGRLAARLEHFSKYVILNKTDLDEAIEKANLIKERISAEFNLEDEKDSNNDGISDNITRLLCEGGLLTGTGVNVFDGISYEELQENADYDYDGLLNGEEVVYSYYNNSMLVIVKSDPNNADSDDDGYSDAEEVKDKKTDPLGYEMILSEYEQDALNGYIDRDNFMSAEYSDSYDDSTSKKVATWIGNNIYGSNNSMVAVYEKVLLDYFKYLSSVKPVKYGENTLISQLGVVDKGIAVAIKDAYQKLVNIGSVSPADYDEAENILQSYENEIKRLVKENNKAKLDYSGNKIPESVLDAITQDNNSVIDKITSDIDDFWDEDITSMVYKDDFINTRTGKISKIEKIEKGFGITLTAAELISNGYYAYKLYEEAAQQADIINEYSYILDSIIKHTNNTELREASKIILDCVNEKTYDAISVIVKYKSVGTIAKVAVDELVNKINPYFLIVEIGISIGDMAFKYSDTALEMKRMWALTQVADYVTNDFRSKVDVFTKRNSNNQLNYVYKNKENVINMIDYFNAVVTLRLSSEKECVKYIETGNNTIVNFLLRNQSSTDDIKEIANLNISYLSKIIGLYKLKKPYEVSASKGSINVEKLLESLTGRGTINIYVKDALTNDNLTGVKVYVDNKLYTTTTTEATVITVSADTEHTIRAVKTGYIDVLYNEVTVGEDENISLETFMQVPYNENSIDGNVEFTVKNAVTGSNISNMECLIRKGMNTTTGEIIADVFTDANGKIRLADIEAGNYTCLIEKDGYIKTIFNFVCIGGMSRSYEIHVSPTLNSDEMRIVLSWGANPRDLDSHISGNGYHVYYVNKTGKGMELDVDDTSGYGPETITLNLSAMNQGVYSYYVYLYSGSGTIATSGASIKVYSGDTLIKTYYAEQDNISGRYWYVFSIDTNSRTISDM